MQDVLGGNLYPVLFVCPGWGMNVESIVKDMSVTS